MCMIKALYTFSELKSAGIEPAVTLYHWDIPQALDLQGNGFTTRLFTVYCIG